MMTEAIKDAKDFADKILADRTAAKKLPYISNPSNIPWPTDVHGNTRELRRSIIKSVATVRYFPDKYKLLKETLELSLKYLDMRYEREVNDHEKNLRRAVDIADRLHSDSSDGSGE